MILSIGPHIPLTVFLLQEPVAGFPSPALQTTYKLKPAPFYHFLPRKVTGDTLIWALGFEPHRPHSKLELVNEFVQCIAQGLEEAKSAIAKVKDEYAMYYNRQ
jgi:hypothetical protein